MHFANDMILEHKPDRVELLGDLFHTHSILRLEVIDFWNAWLDVLSEATDLFVLVGNHDQSGDYQAGASALTVFQHMKKRKLKIIENARHEGLYAYVAYHHNHTEFIEKANAMYDLGARVLVCHQTFNGSKYESGMYAPDGIDPALLKFDTIISGHIHSTQVVIVSETKTVDYPGTAKWDTASDANEKKGLWLYEHDDVTGVVTSKTMLSTDQVCTPIISVQWLEGQPMPELPEKAKASVELIGSSDWISKHKALLKGTVSIKSKITDRANREERVAGKSFLDFVSNFYTSSVDRLELVSYLKELGLT